MKHYKLLAILFGIITIFSMGCEPDDICPESTPTTPSLIIRFYDISNQESKKNVFGLRVQGVGNDNPLTDYNVVNTDSIVLPLKTESNSTAYKLHKEYEYIDEATPPNGNEDIITINYTTEEVYVSRACGYKTVFKNVTLTINDDGDNWIQSKESLNDNQSVEDETAAHFKLYH
jgi:hypothetical protein